MTAQAHPIGWFEIAGEDRTKTEEFYSAAFNWTFSDSPMGAEYRFADAGDGVPGAVATAAPGMPTSYAMFSIMVPDVAESCRLVTELGGKVLLGPESIPGSGLTFANLQDPNGNIIGVFTPPAG